MKVDTLMDTSDNVQCLQDFPISYLLYKLNQSKSIIKKAFTLMVIKLDTWVRAACLGIGTDYSDKYDPMSMLTIYHSDTS